MRRAVICTVLMLWCGSAPLPARGQGQPAAASFVMHGVAHDSLGHGVAGLLVYIFGTGQMPRQDTVRTDSAGGFVVRVHSPGVFELVARREDQDGDAISVRVPADSNRRLVLSLRWLPPGEVVISPGDYPGCYSLRLWPVGTPSVSAPFPDSIILVDDMMIEWLPEPVAYRRANAPREWERQRGGSFQWHSHADSIFIVYRSGDTLAASFVGVVRANCLKGTVTAEVWAGSARPRWQEAGKWLVLGRRRTCLGWGAT